MSCQSGRWEVGLFKMRKTLRPHRDVPDVWRPVLRSSVVREMREQHAATVEVSPVNFLLSLGELEAEVLEVRMHQQLFTAPAPSRVLVETPQCEVHPLTAQLPGQLVLQRFYSPGVGNTQSTEKLVGLNYQ